MKESTKAGLIMLLIGMATVATGAILIDTNNGEPDTDYQYEVKAEQVNDANTVNESYNFDTLNDEEREVIFRAFKKSDHFLGGASAVVEYDEPQQNLTLDKWRVIRVSGVPILVAISGPTEVPDREGANLPAVFGGILLIPIGLFTLLAGIEEVLGV